MFFVTLYNKVELVNPLTLTNNMYVNKKNTDQIH